MEHKLSQFIKRGDFTLKSGEKSDIYINLKEIISDPPLLKEICQELYKLIDYCDFICGVPYAGIPIASFLSCHYDIPMLMMRKEIKDYGMKNPIEGNYKKGNDVILIEDVITTGGSVKEAIKVIESQGLNVVKVICIVNRGNNGYDCLYHINELRLKKTLFKPCLEHFANENANKLCQIIKEKGTNICFSLDVNDTSMLEKVAPYICMVKIHSEIVNCHIKIAILAAQYNFMIMEDRKLADIDHIIQQQASSFIWADAITVHGITKQLVNNSIIVAEMSCDSLIDSSYTKECIKLALQNPEKVMGFVCQKKLHKGFLHFSPGVHLETSKIKGQNYRTPSPS